MQQRRLDIMSDVMALTAFRNLKNIIVIAAELSGSFREDVFRSAVREASLKFPAMRSVLKEVFHHGQFFFIRESAAVDDVPIFVTKFPDLDANQSSFDALMELLKPRLDRRWSLFREPPVEIHLLESNDGRVIAAFVFHHSSSDAAMGADIVTEVFGQYEKILTGTRSEWLSAPYVLSTSRKKASSTKTLSWKDFLFQSLRDLSYRKSLPVKPGGNGTPKDLREWHVRELFSIEDTSQILSAFSEDGGHVVDHLVACTTLALEEWNTARNLPADNITSVVTVNMRSRFGGEDEKNYSSSLYFRTSAEQRTGYFDLVDRLAKSRERQMEKRWDLALRKSFSAGSKVFAIFPIWVRRRAAYTVMTNQDFSIAVGYLGKIWPALGLKGISSASNLRKVGNLEILDIFGSGYKVAGSAYANLYAYVYGGKLNLILTSPAAILEKSECRDFLNLISSHVKRVAKMRRKRDEKDQVSPKYE